MIQKIQSINLILLTGCVIILFYLQFNKKSVSNVGFVRSQELVYQFDGMKEAMVKFEQEQNEWIQNIEVLKKDYQNSLDIYNQELPNLSKAEIANKENLLQHQYNNVLKYTEEMEVALAERENEILEGVLNQVNAFSENFAKESGLDLLITTSVSGTVLYGNETIDYTEELLTSINNQYNGIE